MTMEELTFYELKCEADYPGRDKVYRGTRKTKDEWMDLFGITSDEFDKIQYGWFRQVADRHIEIDLCTAVAMDALEIGSCNSRTSLEQTLRHLKELEADATDIAKAYGLRVAHDTLKAYIEHKQDPTPEVIRQRIRTAWENATK